MLPPIPLRALDGCIRGQEAHVLSVAQLAGCVVHLDPDPVARAVDGLARNFRLGAHLVPDVVVGVKKIHNLYLVKQFFNYNILVVVMNHGDNN